MVRNRISTFFLRVTDMRNEDIQKEIDRMTNNRMDSIGTMEEQKEFDNKRNYVMIEKLIEDVVTQLDKDPMDQMVDTETIIREYTKKIVNDCIQELGKSMKGDPYMGDVYDCEYNTCIDDQINVLKDRFGVD